MLNPLIVAFSASVPKKTQQEWISRTTKHCHGYQWRVFADWRDQLETEPEPTTTNNNNLTRVVQPNKRTATWVNIFQSITKISVYKANENEINEKNSHYVGLDISVIHSTSHTAFECVYLTNGWKQKVIFVHVKWMWLKVFNISNIKPNQLYKKQHANYVSYMLLVSCWISNLFIHKIVQVCTHRQSQLTRLCAMNIDQYQHKEKITMPVCTDHECVRQSTIARVLILLTYVCN